MSENNDSELTDALAGISEGLMADGYQLTASWVEPGRVAVTIEATESACADCLVPPQIMRSIVVTVLGDAGITVDDENVEISYPAGSASH